jgi:hypothetical protein
MRVAMVDRKRRGRGTKEPSNPVARGPIPAAGARRLGLRWGLRLRFFVMAACAAPPATPREPVAIAVLPHVPFSKLDRDQRIQLMKEQVVPTMRPLFVGHDATKFASFGCETCHRNGAHTGRFEMPNPELPILTFDDMSSFDRRDIEWMKSEVSPAMAKLVDESPFTPDNPTGFGCSSCHVRN